MPSKKETNSEGIKPETSDSYQPANRQAPVLQDEDYITNRIDASVDRMNHLSTANQVKFKRLKKAAIIIGSTIPLCVTITTLDSVDQAPLIKIPLLIYSALGGTVLAMMNNLLKTGNYYDNWKNYRSISETLLREKYLYLTKMTPYHKSDAFPLVVEKVEGLLADEEENIGQDNQNED